ncbi:unnamed protein product, partial [Staurois parvus]
MLLQRNTQQHVSQVKHTQHTVNPLINQMLTSSCPVSLVQCQCFLLVLITVLVSLGYQWKLVPPSVRMSTAVPP